MPDKPTMHCQAELEADLHYSDFIPDELLMRWFNDNYSASKHLLTLYSMARGLQARRILEIGFGRSSFVLARAAHENDGMFYSCDSRDFSYLLNDAEKSCTQFIHGMSDLAYEELGDQGVDFAFLDYFSSTSLKASFVKAEIKKCIALLKENGIIAIHDAIVTKYHLRKALGQLGAKTFFGSSEIEVLSLPYNYGLGLVRKKGPSPFGALEDGFQKKKQESEIK